MEPTSTGAHRYIGLEHIDPGLPSLRRWGTDRHLKSTKSRFYAGDILYGKLRPYLDKAAVAEWEGVCSTDILTLQRHKDEADSQYIGFLLHTSAFLSYAVATTSGVNHPRTSWTDIARFSYPVPPVQEQRAIAGVLSKILAAVELQEQFVAAFKELKAATMAKLFREGLRGEPLKQTEIGEIPQSWNVIDMGSVCKKINYGTSVRCTGERNGRPVLRIPNIINEGIDESELKWAALPDNEVPKLLLQPGDLLFVRTNGNKEYLGRCAVYEDQPQGALFASYLIRVRLAQEAVLPAFVQAYLSSVGREQITRRAHAASDGKYNIDTGVLREVLLLVPQLGEQHAIVGLLRTVERRLAAARDQVRQAKSLFSSMLHLLMTGRVRVTPKMIALHRVADRAAQREKWSGKVDEKVLEQVVKRIVEAVAPEKIIVFGSAARGEMGPDSDLDLLIVKSGVHRLATAQMIEHSLIGIAIPTDIVVATPKDIEVHKDTIGLIYRPALQEGKILYAA
jgi:type I restriction enzyme S subunit